MTVLMVSQQCDISEIYAPTGIRADQLDSSFVKLSLVLKADITVDQLLRVVHVTVQ